MKFYQLPNNNLSTHLLLFFSREATSKPTAPRSSFSYICLAIYFFLVFIFRSIKPKIQKYLAAINSYLFYLALDLSIYYKFTSRSLPILRRRTPKEIDNPFNTSGCEVLLFVCKGCLRCVAWFSYWVKNVGLISEGNTYRRCAASSLPLWGNTDVASSDIRARSTVRSQETR